MRDIAYTCRITERSACRIVIDLERAGCLTRQRIGRRNRYTLHPERVRCHPAEAHLLVHALLGLSPITTTGSSAEASRRRGPRSVPLW
jgi:hypothetical protein